MNNQSVTDAEVAKYLGSYADLNCFYITRSKSIDGAMLSYVDGDGKAWVLMEDDDQLLGACVRFLERRGNRVFNSFEEERQYVAGLEGGWQNTKGA